MTNFDASDGSRKRGARFIERKTKIRHLLDGTAKFRIWQVGVTGDNMISDGTAFEGHDLPKWACYQPHARMGVTHADNGS